MNRIIKIINRHLDDLVSQMEKDNDTYIMIVNEDFYLINDFGKISGLDRTSILNQCEVNRYFEKAKKDNFFNKKYKIEINSNSDCEIFLSFYKVNEDIYIVTVGRNDDAFSNYMQMLVKIVVEFANEITEMELEMKKIKRLNYFEKKILETMQIGYICLNKEGRIKSINNLALELMGEDNMVLGKELREITEFEPDVLNVLQNGQGWHNKEFIINLRKRKKLHLLKSCIPLYDENNQIVGALDMFRRIENVKKFVNRLSGSKAMFCFDDIVAESDDMKGIINFARKMAKYDSSILIEGESGTGKELLAHAIHNESDRRKEPFITIDCTSLPNNLVESELFGYVEGAFTGAKKGGRPGKFEMADGGTVFLDEIGELPLEMQKKLLRVLQSRTITRIGDYESLPVDIRIIAATNRDLDLEIMEKGFREDLFYRINVINIKVPPLRERKEDIISIAIHFMNELGRNIGKKELSMDKKYQDALLRFDWQGNIRQLRNTIERAVNLVDGQVISYELLPNAIRNKLQIQEYKSSDNLNYFEKYEKEKIVLALEKHERNKSKVADELNISRSTLYSKMKKYNLT